MGIYADQNLLFVLHLILPFFICMNSLIGLIQFLMLMFNSSLIFYINFLIFAQDEISIQIESLLSILQNQTISFFKDELETNLSVLTQCNINLFFQRIVLGIKSEIDLCVKEISSYYLEIEL